MPSARNMQFHYSDIDHAGTQSSSANSCAMLMRPNKAETAVHGSWLLSSIFNFFLVAMGFYPFYHCRRSVPTFTLTLSYQVTFHSPSILHDEGLKFETSVFQLYHGG